jgi:hypothetical protein
MGARAAAGLCLPRVPPARLALVENRLQDAAQLLMRQYELSCLEVSHLLDISVC